MKKITIVLTATLLLLTLSISSVNGFKTSMELPTTEMVGNDLLDGDDNGASTPKIKSRGVWVPLKACRYRIFTKVCNIYKYRR